MTNQNGYARIGALFVSLLTAVLLAACSTTPKPEQAAAEEQLSDAEILAVLSAINQAEIRQAELALEKSRDFKVRSTAMSLFADHRALQRKAQQTAALADIQPQQNELSQGITKQALQIEKRLNGLAGNEFNQAYLQAQAQLHELAIDTVRDDLLPDVQNQQLKQLLTQAEPGLQRHLQQARQARQAQDSTSRG